MRGRIIKKQPGTYTVDIKPLPVPRNQCKSEEEYQYDVSGCEEMRRRGTIPIKSGDVFVGDPCYYFDRDKWLRFINKYYPNKSRCGKFPKSVVELKLDGDGDWDVELELKRVVK
jgi:hypothetical protein